MNQFSNRGAAVIAFCPQRQEFNDAVKNNLGLEFPVIRDADNQLATRFGLTLSTPPQVAEAEMQLGLDLPTHNDSDNWDLPIPARFAIDTSAMIRYSSVHVDHRQRNDPAECLAVIDQF